MFDLFRNYLNSIIGRNQEFEKLLQSKDISSVIDQMSNRREKIDEALKDYDTFSHEIMKREDKIITDKNGKFLRKEPVWKLPIPYPVYINEISLVFLYGRPVKWSQLSEGTDNAFNYYIDLLRRLRFDSKIRQCKRIAGAETESAMLFRVFRNNEGKPDAQIRVLAKSKGDDVYVRWDQYENIISIGWGYYVKENEKVNYHFDIYTPGVIYRCSRESLGWKVIEEENLIGKIPIILFQQDKEWAGVEPLIHREEYIASRSADTNDYFADPIAIMDAELVKNLPEKKDANKLLITKGQDGVNKAAKYLTWDNAPQSKKDEIEWLQDQIHSKTFTPKISLDSLKSLGNLSAKALRTVMLLADIKASKHKEVHDELLDRTASLVTAIIGNVLDVSLKSECEKLQIGHEFQEPFGEDITESINNIVKLYDAGLLSQEGGVELNPLVKDHSKEMQRINDEQEARMQQRNDLFGNTEQEEILPTAE
jgi:SPP1 family phage portal protein